jgi:ClpP class serine protease
MLGPTQLSLLHNSRREVIASGGFVAGMKAAMRGVVDASGKSRDQVVDAMNEIVKATGKGLCKGSKTISLPTLEKWLADEERGQLPDLWGLHVLMLATGNRLQPLEAWLLLFGCGVLDETGRKKIEFAELELKRENDDARRRNLKKELRGIL